MPLAYIGKSIQNFQNSLFHDKRYFGPAVVLLCAMVFTVTHCMPTDVIIWLALDLHKVAYPVL